MSADLVTDPAIFATYHELRNPDSALDWLFLAYSAAGSKDRLELADRGDSGLEGLKATLSQSNALNIHFGLLRLEGRFLLLTLLPDNTGGVKRARALVHSRAVGTKLQHQATLTVARPSDLTINAVRSKLKLDTGSASSSLPSSPNPQWSAGASAPSPYMQPSPLRSHFPANQVYANTDDAPPPPPDKDGQTILKARSNNSLRTPQLATPPFSPPMRQSSREAQRSASPQHVQHSPPNNNSPGERTRQLSTASASSANSPASVGLGLGGSISSLQSQQNGRTAIPHSLSGYSNTSVSSRFASSGFEPDQRREESHNGPSGPTIGNIPEGHSRYTPRPISPAGSAGSGTWTNNAQPPQDLPLPLSASPSISTSARSLEASTLDSMFRPSESLECMDSVMAARWQRSPKSSPTQVERIAVAEAIARAAEAKWQTEQRRTSTDSGDPVRQAGVQSVPHNGFVGQKSSPYVEQPVASSSRIHNSEDQNGLTDDLVKEQEKEPLPSDAEAELARLEEEAIQRARAQEKAEADRKESERQCLEAEAEAQRQKDEAAEAERLRLAAKAEEEQRRVEVEAEAERQRKEAEAEAGRQRKEAEAEAERQRQEAEAAAEAERIRLEEAKIAEENARLEAIETAKREKEKARQRAHQDLRDRIRSSPNDVALTGFLSVQGGDSILWRRRYFQMTSQTLKLYKNDKDLVSPMVEVVLAGKVKIIDENAEDLMAIPHSFKLIFNDYDEEPYLFYCDEEADKDLLLVGLRAATDLE